jgi:sortase A
MRSRNLVLILAALAVVVALAACSSSGQSSEDKGQAPQKKAAQEQQANKQVKKQANKQVEKQVEKQEPPKKMTDEAKSKQVAPTMGVEGGPEKVANRVEPPEKMRLKLTVPAMKRIEDDPIPTGIGTDEKLFHDYAGVHLASSGMPWKETANVYIAGHRIGFPGTKSNLAFYDLEDLKNGDKVYLEDAEGRKYTYEVYEKLVVEAGDLSVIQPIEGKNIVSLQSCTLPDYAERVIYRAELEGIES